MRGSLKVSVTLTRSRKYSFLCHLPVLDAKNETILLGEGGAALLQKETSRLGICKMLQVCL